MSRRPEPSRVLVDAHTTGTGSGTCRFSCSVSTLVHVVDDVLDLLETDPAFGAVTLDGQAVILEDSLEIRSHAEDRLRTLVEAGRLLVGSGYVQPDEFLPSGEALIRNLLVGRAVGGDSGSRWRSEFGAVGAR